MATTYSQYAVDEEIEAFFKKTSATRAACDAKARELAGGKVVPVEVQGVCSYSVYAGPELEHVVQFRLESLAHKTEIISQVNEVYGSLAPALSLEGKLGDGTTDGEALNIYLMSRVRGVTHLDFILAHNVPENSPESFSWRTNLLSDIAHFMALSWNSPRPSSLQYRQGLRQAYLKDLNALYLALPSRFEPILQSCIDSIDDILSLPMVLLHRDFGTCNIMVHEETCHLVGVIDWAEADVCPFGLNLHSLQALTGKLHLRNGWTRYDDHDSLQEVFWERFKSEVGGLSDDRLRVIKLSRVLGLLLSRGFTSRLANEPEPVPIGDDERGRYNMMFVDGLLNPQTKFDS